MDGITDEKSNDRVYFDAKKNASEKNTAVTFPSQGKSILEVVKSFVKGSEKGKQTLFSYSSEDEDSLIEDTGKLRRLEAVDEDEGDYGFQMEGLGDSDDEQESK